MSADKYKMVTEDYDNVDPSFHNSYDTTQEYASQFASFMSRVSDNQTILNIGGTVAECSHFADSGYKVTNLDLSQAILDHISKLDKRVELIRGNVKDYKGGTFDGIWACRSLIHIPPEDLGKTLKNIHTLLAPNGVFGCIMFTTNEEAPKEEYLPEPHAEKSSITYYRTLYSPTFLAKAFESAGFNVVKQEDCADKDGELSVYFELTR